MFSTAIYNSARECQRRSSFHHPPTSDYYTIVKMSNHAVVGVFRQHVFARRSTRRYAPPIPEEHDSYCVKRTPERVMVQIFHDGNEVYRCIFVPPADY